MVCKEGYNKHLMTGPEGNSEFCFPETLIEVEGKQNSLFPMGPVIIIINNNKLQIYIAQFPWRDDQLRITTIHGIK